MSTHEQKSLALVPSSIGETQDLARIYAKSSLLPPDLRGKEADVFVTIMAGMELGLAPMAALRSIHVVKGKPILSADGMVAVVQASGLCEYFTCVESSAAIATYETKRRGAPTPQRLSFTVEEAKIAGIAGGDNWKKYPAAMLRARAKAALARDVYPDAIAGVYTDDEARDFVDARPRNAPPVRVTDEEFIDAEVVETKSLHERIEAATTIHELGGLVDEIKNSPKEARDALRPLYAERRRILLQADAQREADAL